MASIQVYIQYRSRVLSPQQSEGLKQPLNQLSAAQIIGQTVLRETCLHSQANADGHPESRIAHHSLT